MFLLLKATTALSLCMIKSLFAFCMVLVTATYGQEIKAEFDKNHDFTGYKTFSFGASEILTPKDQRKIKDATLDGWIKSAVARELNEKGLTRVEQDADLVITYAIGTLSRSAMQSVGPATLTPGADATNQRMYDYQETSLVIDLNNRKNYLVWRVNAVANMAPTDAENVINQIVGKGFKKYSSQPAKKRK